MKAMIGNAVQMHGHARALEEAYAVVLRPLCAELSLPQNALDILLFLANNPGYDTARDICFYRHMKPGIVSFHIDRLVSEGYLVRRSDEKDRRVTHLVPTDAAAPVVARGRELQVALGARLTEGLSAEDCALFWRCIATIDENAKCICREAAQKEKNDD